MYKPIRWVLTAALLTATSTAFAQGFDITAGPTTTSGARFTSAAFASVFGEPPADGRFHLAPIATVGWIAPHHTYDENLHHNVFLAGGGVRIIAPGGHWFASEQLAATSTRTDALSSRFELMTSGGWQDGHFIVMVRHISNGHIVGGSPNLGETMLLAGVKF
ncbi:MAG: hypothetical protein ACREPH_04040 [Rhodanobacteraceae bacterium]